MYPLGDVGLLSHFALCGIVAVKSRKIDVNTALYFSDKMDYASHAPHNPF
jgi:hypothetical protein